MNIHAALRDHHGGRQSYLCFGRAPAGCGHRHLRAGHPDESIIKYCVTWHAYKVKRKKMVIISVCKIIESGVYIIVDNEGRRSMQTSKCQSQDSLHRVFLLRTVSHCSLNGPSEPQTFGNCSSYFTEIRAVSSRRKMHNYR